jgi:signal peptidase I
VSLPLVRRLPDPWRKVVDWVVTLAVAVGFVLAFEAEVAKPFRIPSSSMEPYLQCARPGPGCTGSMSDRVLVNRLAYDFGSPQRGQIVVFKAPPGANNCQPGDAGTTFVKRLIGLPGETVREDGQGFIWVRKAGATTWTRLGEPYVSGSRRLDDKRHFDHTWKTVPQGAYFMLGDNRANSCDSRTWGPVPRADLIGPVILTYWPPGRISYHSGGF